MAGLQRFDAFVFDLDGTLLDTLDDLTVLTNTTLKEFGMPTHTTEEICSYVGNGARALIYQAVPENTAPDEADRCLARWKELYDVYGNDLTRPYEGVPEMLADLRQRGCKLGVLSNKFDSGVRFIMDKCLPGAVDVAHGESNAFPRKPDPTGLLRTIAELGCEPARTVYVGDSPGDVITARNVGCFAVGVPWGYHEVDDFARADVEPDWWVQTPDELVGLVAG